MNYGEPTLEYDGYIREPKVFEEADAIDIEDWLAELDERYTNASSVGKGDAALVSAYTELNKLIQAGRIDAQGWVRETPADRASYTPNDKSTVKSRKSKEDLHYLKPEQVQQSASDRSCRDKAVLPSRDHRNNRS
ncbi:hypothetical protein [Halostagnicola sp. A56]|uniref:hypothetical protein n=1 Tax=Halostagnicola sp. A56 TaxID=1495067 RepID=UPI0012E129F2|nr:hypothetical protein [Halostagnicola sp. A56]